MLRCTYVVYMCAATRSEEQDEISVIPLCNCGDIYAMYIDVLFDCVGCREELTACPTWPHNTVLHCDLFIHL